MRIRTKPLALQGFTHNNPHYKLFAIATPIIIQNLVIYLQLQVDMAMLGQANSLFLSAVGNVLFPYNIVVAFLTSLSTGVTVLSSHSFGGRSFKSAKRYSEVSFFFNFLVAIPFFLTLFLFANPLLTWMGTSEQINAYGTVFLKSLSFSVLFLGVTLSIAATLLGAGKTTNLMIAAVISTVSNVFFDWVLIYGKLGFPELSIQGAGVATSIANFCGMIYLIIALIFTKGLPFKPSIKGILNPRWRIQRRSVTVGLPFGLEAMFWSFGQIIMVRMVNGVDEFAAGLYVLIVRIQAVTFFFYLGIARATMVLVGREIGANNRGGAYHVAFMSLKYAFATCTVASIIFLIYPEQILSIFSSDALLIQRAVPLLNIVSITIFPVAVNVVLGNAIRGLKDTKWMFYTQTFGTIFVISVSAILLFTFKLDLKGVLITVLLDEVIRGFLNYRRFKSLAI
jgi:putative MATE family efflux protein